MSNNRLNVKPFNSRSYGGKNKGGTPIDSTSFTSKRFQTHAQSSANNSDGEV